MELVSGVDWDSQEVQVALREKLELFLNELREEESAAHSRLPALLEMTSLSQAQVRELVSLLSETGVRHEVIRIGEAKKPTNVLEIWRRIHDWLQAEFTDQQSSPAHEVLVVSRQRYLRELLHRTDFGLR